MVLTQQKQENLEVQEVVAVEMAQVQQVQVIVPQSVLLKEIMVVLDLQTIHN